MPHVAPGFSLAAFLRERHCETILLDHGWQTIPCYFRNETCRSEERRYTTVAITACAGYSVARPVVTL